MKALFKFLFIAVSVVYLTGCATIVSKRYYPVNIQSEPAGATFTIKDSKGKVISSGKTPKEVTLKAGAGYFKRATYHITFNRAGYAPKTITLTATLDEWYMGNIALLSPLGALIIDPLTGAMYKLPDNVNVSLGKGSNKGLKKSKNRKSKTAQLQILYIDDLTDEQKGRLTAI